MVYLNNERTIYAKATPSGLAEPGTVRFISDECVMMNRRMDFDVGEQDKITVVIWIEGDDPECVDALIGGQMKMHMEITEEHLDQMLHEND